MALTLHHKDAIACDITDHPASENPSVEKLPVLERMNYVQFYGLVDQVKNKGQMNWLLSQYMAKGEQRGFLNANEYPEQMQKIRDMSSPL